MGDTGSEYSFSGAMENKLILNTTTLIDTGICTAGQVITERYSPISRLETKALRFASQLHKGFIISMKIIWELSAMIVLSGHIASVNREQKSKSNQIWKNKSVKFVREKEVELPALDLFYYSNF